MPRRGRGCLGNPRKHDLSRCSDPGFFDLVWQVAGGTGSSIRYSSRPNRGVLPQSYNIESERLSRRCCRGSALLCVRPFSENNRRDAHSRWWCLGSICSLTNKSSMPTLYGKSYTREEFLKRVGTISQVGGVTLYQLQDGPEAG